MTAAIAERMRNLALDRHFAPSDETPDHITTTLSLPRIDGDLDQVKQYLTEHYSDEFAYSIDERYDDGDTTVVTIWRDENTVGYGPDEVARDFRITKPGLTWTVYDEGHEELYSFVY